jgi:hypothetical protein
MSDALHMSWLAGSGDLVELVSLRGKEGYERDESRDRDDSESFQRKAKEEESIQEGGWLEQQNVSVSKKNNISNGSQQR